jgi:hypothetical protein
MDARSLCGGEVLLDALELMVDVLPCRIGMSAARVGVAALAAIVVRPPTRRRAGVPTSRIVGFRLGIFMYSPPRRWLASIEPCTQTRWLI